MSRHLKLQTNASPLSQAGPISNVAHKNKTVESSMEPSAEEPSQKRSKVQSTYSVTKRVDNKKAQTQERFMTPCLRPVQPFLSLRPPVESEPGIGLKFNRFGAPPPGRFPGPARPWYEVPPTDLNVLKQINTNPTVSVDIDGISRDIRFYGQTAVVLSTLEDPREISFQNVSRSICMNDRDYIIAHCNAPPQEIIIGGKTKRVRLGAPTRELYVENEWFTITFGGPPVICKIDGALQSVKLEGPPPRVRFGLSRRDLVVGKVTLIIDSKFKFPIYLDALPQKFKVKSVPYIIQFVDALQKTLINGVAFNSDFGGMQHSIILNGTEHFFHLTKLPIDITPGFVSIANMRGGPKPPALLAPPQLSAILEKGVPSNLFLQPPKPSVPVTLRLSAEILNQVNAGPPVHPVSPTVISADSTTLNVSSASNDMPSWPTPTLSHKYNYKSSDKHSSSEEAFTRLVSLFKLEPPKIKQIAFVYQLYFGNKCASCGMRFSPEKNVSYREHLDWHFRQNHRNKKSSSFSRKYYYSIDDWKIFEENEDPDERVKPWFDMQDSSSAEAKEPLPAVSVAAADYPLQESCHICRDKFEIFYNEEKEEWHLRNAVDCEGHPVHPVCFEDQKDVAVKHFIVDFIDITEGESKEPDIIDDDIIEIFSVEDLTVLNSESDSDITEDKKEEGMGALGGEFEEPSDVDNSLKKGEIPLPILKVNTSHATVTSRIDGNVELEEISQQISVGGPPMIKINIKKKTVKVADVPKIQEIRDKSPDLADQVALNQPPPPGVEPVNLIKPRILGHYL